MATTKETTAKVAAAVNGKVTEVKAAEKEVATKATETVKKTADTAKKTASEKTATAKKTITKKATETAAKAKTTALDLNTEVYVQFANQECIVKDVVARAKAQYVEEGHKLASVKSIQVYIKPEDNSAYYVINKKAAGRIDLF